MLQSLPRASYTVVVVLAAQGVAVVGHHYHTSLSLLRLYSTHRHVSGISINNKTVLSIRVGQDGGFHQGSVSGSAGVIPDERSSLVPEAVQRASHRHSVLHKALIVGDESLHLTDVTWCRPILQSPICPGQWPHRHHLRCAPGTCHKRSHFLGLRHRPTAQIAAKAWRRLRSAPSKSGAWTIESSRETMHLLRGMMA